MEKINFTNYPNMNKPVNSNNLNQLQKNVENSFKSTKTESDNDTYNCNYINSKIYDSGWIEVSLENGWENISGRTLKYRKIGSTVYIEGTITSGTYSRGTKIFTLPEGFRCGSNYQKFICAYYQNNITPVSLYTNLDGDVVIDTGLPGNTELSISITFATTN